MLDFVPGQLGLADPSVVKRYAERVKTKSDHHQEIRRASGLRDFAGAELAGWVAARAWTSGDGPRTIFLDAVAWLRERKIPLPGVTTLARLGFGGIELLDAGRLRDRYLRDRPDLPLPGTTLIAVATVQR